MLLGVEEAFQALDEALAEAGAARRRRWAACVAEDALDRLDHRLEAASTPVDVSQAAEILGVSTPTVRGWIRRGLLKRVPGRTPVAVTFDSVRWARGVLTVSRAESAPRSLVRQLEEAAAVDPERRPGPIRLL